jgi:hypothetical protein
MLRHICATQNHPFERSTAIVSAGCRERLSPIADQPNSASPPDFQRLERRGRDSNPRRTLTARNGFRVCFRAAIFPLLVRCCAAVVTTLVTLSYRCAARGCSSAVLGRCSVPRVHSRQGAMEVAADGRVDCVRGVRGNSLPEAHRSARVSYASDTKAATHDSVFARA